MMERFAALPEDEVIKTAQAGDGEATEYMLNKYKNLVRSKAKALYLTGADKEDLIQEGMIGLYKALCGYSPEKESGFLHYADLCVSRQMYTAIKTSNRRKNQPLNNYVSFAALETKESDGGMLQAEVQEVPLQGRFANPEDVVIDRENVNRLEGDLLKQLSAFERKVLLYYMTGCPYTKIAELLEKEPKSIDNALQRVRKKVNAVWEREKE